MGRKEKIMTDKRVYATIEDMYKVAKLQWREFIHKQTNMKTDELSDDELFEMAATIICNADETGEYGKEIDGEWIPYFTMEMESWARDTTDGIEVEILIEDEYEYGYEEYMQE